MVVFANTVDDCLMNYAEQNKTTIQLLKKTHKEVDKIPTEEFISKFAGYQGQWEQKKLLDAVKSNGCLYAK